MANDRSLAVREQAELQEQPNVITVLSGLTVPDNEIVIQLAARLVDHWRGKITGGYKRVPQKELDRAKESGFPPDWRKTLDKDGQEIIVKPPENAWDKGELLFNDAIWIIEKWLPLAVNPLAHIWLWYQDGQIIDHLEYTVKVGWAEDQASFTTEFVDMSDEDRRRHSLEKGDLGVFAYTTLESDKREYRMAILDLIKGGLSASDAKLAALEIFAKAKGVGIVRADEMTSKRGKPIPPPKGRSWQWKVEKRAQTDAINKSMGKPSPTKIIQGMKAQKQALQPGDISALLEPGYPDDASAEVQAQYIEAHRRAEKIKTSPNPNWQANVAAMRDNGDDDPLALSSESGDYDYDMPDDRSDSGAWYPDFGEFKENLVFNFKRPWQEIEMLLKEKCGYTDDHFEHYDPVEASEMYEALGSYLVSNESE